MEKQLFRQKSIDRISSPEQLQDYMRVTNPGIWMVLGAVIAILVGMIVFSIVGKLETRVPVQAVSEDGTVSVTLPLPRSAPSRPACPCASPTRKPPSLISL